MENQTTNTNIKVEEVEKQSLATNTQINDLLPNQTLYINNLNEKIKVDGKKTIYKSELKQAVFHLFAQYGEILEVHAKKTLKLRGQAFIVFKDLNAASSAKHGLNGSILFGNELKKINYARNNSDSIAKLTGNYVHKDKVKRDIEKKKKREEDIKVFKKKKEDKDKLAPKKDKDIVRKDFVDQTKKSQSLTPNNILFIENLSSQISEPMLKNLFAQYLGFREVRILSGKGIAFIEYDNEINAGTALVGKDISYIGLNGLQLTPDCVLQISFAKK